MVSPMREKRAWPPQDRDADGESVAAFEATVAVVKETVVRSGEVLVSAKEDLSDHRRWLKAQTEAVQADRERHDRWLQRQRERQEALERREQKRAKRRAARQAALQAVKDSISRALFAVRSAIQRTIAGILKGLKDGLHYVFGSVLGSVAWFWGKLREGLQLATGVAHRSAVSAGSAVQAGARSTVGHLRSAVAVGSGKFQAWAPSAGRLVSAAFGGLSARVRDASNSIGRGLAPAAGAISAKATAVARDASAALGPAMRGARSRAYALAPALWDQASNAAGRVLALAETGTARIQHFLAAAKGTPAEGENALSSLQRLRGFELSQMLIIAGTLLLVLGGLMLGGGLMLRAGTPPASAIEAASPAEPVAWLFEQTDFPLAERSIFAWERTPEGVRIKGFSIGAVNLGDDPINALEALLKPDLHGEDLKLDLEVDKPGDAAGAEQATEVAAAKAAGGAIPSQAPFKLVFLFPATEAPEDVLKASGGVLLKVRYELAGKEKSFIHYLSPEFLEAQLAEIQAEAAKGS
jgi:hypothetical protein